MTEPETLRIDLWPDELAEPTFHARSPYVEQAWTGVVGPTALLALRSTVLLAETAGGPVTIGLDDFARSLGVGGTGRHAPIRRALGRLDAFGLAVALPGGIAVRRRVPPLRRGQLGRAPLHVQALHARYLADHAAGRVA